MRQSVRGGAHSSGVGAQPLDEGADLMRGFIRAAEAGLAAEPRLAIRPFENSEDWAGGWRRGEGQRSCLVSVPRSHFWRCTLPGKAQNGGRKR